MKPLLFLLLTVIFLSCEHEKIENPQLLWRIPSSPNERPLTSIYPIFYKKTVLLSQNSPNHSFFLYAADTEGGTIRWVYRDSSFTNEVSSLYYNQKNYIYKNILLIPFQAQMAAIDLDSGKLIWKNKLHASADDAIEGQGYKAYRNYYDYTLRQILTYQIDIRNGDMQIVKKDTFPLESIVISRTPVPFINNQGDSLLICTTVHQNGETKETQSFVSFYDLKKRVAVFKTNINPSNNKGLGITKSPLPDHKNKSAIFIAFDQIICYDTEKYKELWHLKMGRDMLTSQPALIDGCLYYPSEDGFLYQINPINGKINWKYKTSGTPGRVSGYKNGVCIIGGGDAKWHIIDKKTGNELYQLKTPNLVNYPGSGFQRNLSVFPELGIAVCCDDRDVMCFKM